MTNTHIVPISDIKHILESGKTVKIRGVNNEYFPVSTYVEKGVLDAFETVLVNGNKIKTSAKHEFFSNVGWIACDSIIPNEHMLLCDDGSYQLVVSVSLIGKHNIVDIMVDDDSHAYFGNGILNHNSGKSLLAAHVLLNTQRSGGLAVYIDTENALSTEFLTAIGLNLKEMLYIPLETIEDIFETVETIIEKVRSSDKNRLVTIVVDSIAGASTKIEMAADFDKDGYATSKAIILSKAMRKITNLIGRERICLLFTNQLRQKMNAPAFSDPWISPGGKGVPFHASVRIRLASIGTIKSKINGVDIVVGGKVKAKIVKNRVGPPLRECAYEVYFDSGIDDYSGWISVGKEYGIISGTGHGYTYVNKNTGEVIKFQTKDFVEKIIDVPELAEMLYDEICEKVIMKYQSLDAPRLDDVTIANEPILDNI